MSADRRQWRNTGRPGDYMQYTLYDGDAHDAKELGAVTKLSGFPASVPWRATSFGPFATTDRPNVEAAMQWVVDNVRQQGE